MVLALCSYTAVTGGKGRSYAKDKSRKETKAILCVASLAPCTQEGQVAPGWWEWVSRHLSGKYFSASPERAVQLKSLYMRFLLLYIIVGPGPLWDLRAQTFINLHGTLTPSALSLQAADPGSFSPLLPTSFPSGTPLTRPVYPQILLTGWNPSISKSVGLFSSLTWASFNLLCTEGCMSSVSAFFFRARGWGEGGEWEGVGKQRKGKETVA